MRVYARGVSLCRRSSLLHSRCQYEDKLRARLPCSSRAVWCRVVIVEQAKRQNDVLLQTFKCAWSGVLLMCAFVRVRVSVARPSLCPCACLRHVMCVGSVCVC